MTTHVDDLEAQVMGLPAEDRVRLLEMLLASFEPRTADQQAWMELALQRRQDVVQGRTTMVEGDSALARVRARLS